MTENIVGSWKTDDTSVFTLLVFEFPQKFKYDFNLLSVNYYRALWGSLPRLQVAYFLPIGSCFVMLQINS